jgi:hypothetical protein
MLASVSVATRAILVVEGRKIHHLIGSDGHRTWITRRVLASGKQQAKRSGKHRNV